MLHRRRNTKQRNIHSKMRKEKIWKIGRKAKKQENRTQGVYSNKASRLLPQNRAGNLTLSAIFLLLSLTAVSSVTAAADEPFSVNKSNKTKRKYRDSIFVAQIQLFYLHWRMLCFRLFAGRNVIRTSCCSYHIIRTYGTWYLVCLSSIIRL